MVLDPYLEGLLSRVIPVTEITFLRILRPAYKARLSVGYGTANISGGRSFWTLPVSGSLMTTSFHLPLHRLCLLASPPHQGISHWP